jgi:hypothetical protein
MKVFLGGTCAESKWREYIIPKLRCDYFNPVVEDWTPECQSKEEYEKHVCGYHLYVITPKMKGVFSIAEAVNDSNILHDRCIFCVTKEDDDRDWTDGELRSLSATTDIIRNNGGTILTSLDDVIDYLNLKSDEYDSPNFKKERDYYKKRAEHLSNLFTKLTHAILPEGWYSMAADSWSCEEDMCYSCINRLNRPLVQKIIKYKKLS